MRIRDIIRKCTIAPLAFCFIVAGIIHASMIIRKYYNQEVGLLSMFYAYAIFAGAACLVYILFETQKLLAEEIEHKVILESFEMTQIKSLWQLLKISYKQWKQRKKSQSN